MDNETELIALGRRAPLMLYPRKDGTKLVSEEMMVGSREHLSHKYRILNFSGAIGWELETINLLLALDTLSNEPIKIIISSPGGSLDTTFLIYDTFKLLRSPVYTIGTYCCSAAALLLAAGTKRYMTPHAKVMLHLPFNQLVGDTRDIEIGHREMQSYQKKLIDLLRDCGAKKSPDELLKDIDREFWMSPEETIKYGLCDEILTREQLQGWLK